MLLPPRHYYLCPCRASLPGLDLGQILTLHCANLLSLYRLRHLPLSPGTRPLEHDIYSSRPLWAMYIFNIWYIFNSMENTNSTLEEVS